MTRPLLVCRGCGKHPDDLIEYTMAAVEEGVEPDEYVWEEEGTLDHETGLFWCDTCYIENGMPLR